MSGENGDTTTVSGTRVEKIVEEVLAVVRETTRAMEAEVAALIEAEKAYKKANDAAAELKNATEANKTARMKTGVSRTTAKQASKEAMRAVQLEATADKDEEQRLFKRKKEEEKAVEAEKAGKSFSMEALDEAKRRAKESEQKAEEAHVNAEKARSLLASAEEQVKSAEKELAVTDTRLQKAREADTVAKTEVPRAESIAKRAMKITGEALVVESTTKKRMDLMINRLKALMAEEVKTASKSQTSTKVDADKNEGNNKLETDAESNVDVYRGTVKLLIAGRADHAAVQRFQKQLELVEGFRIKSVYGSGTEGIDITLLAEKPVPLVGRISQIDLVQRISRISRREFEVELKSA